MKLHVLTEEFSVCKVRDLERVDFADKFCFVGKTDREISLVCRTSAAPADAAAREDGWRAFRVEGTLDFSLVGILAEIAGILAGEKISIFAVSTYDTDYILVKRENFSSALAALKRHGYASA